ncbi:bifunctional 4-hydroxy-2-oxoglutarate aldolase/2-dehydro-3-deoxy-phosphogluconate aldolase [Sphaerochaeta sp. PS]|uniref:bifunctional 4-hydroxy-2-oxoglutarate aldolase/2-dehydro-3-deoxy-phosphogluconate aldolase n=1 Tax=Sphaerochaeta sp. PS TaxID=3076336 RepID=UPI0028A57B92|nr:bifunctional 4-hydroxy-2-oxoglutarate aldolase/2-dehydro-3-deoxy-phosphogluconate aldolase [Sphaerochaeta sp. PS]MDT4762779.1 bifunctional 4-hydroxy-2-oxoglutarate aldolase/2-dehydro-3-deoxy-phosphogluconate aldolase [Sphaerochaeta sp. PS]
MNNRNVVLHAIGQSKVISIIRGIETQASLEVIKALYEGGIRCLEITMNTPGALAMITQARESEDLFVGAGTVLDMEDARKAIDAGAQFVLAPCLDVKVIAYCLDRDVLPIPGIFTPTELLLAHQSGAELLKVFPAGSVGPQYIKDLLGPFSGMKLLPVGGVSLENTAAFMKAGSFAVGVGSFLANPTLAKAGDFATIRQRAEQFVSLVQHV